MKKISVIVSILLALILSGCFQVPTITQTPTTGTTTKPTNTQTTTAEPTTTETTTEQATETTKYIEQINFESSTGVLKYVSHEVKKDYEGKPALVVYFDYTNTDEESHSAIWEFDVKAFQNGVEGEKAFLLKDIQEHEDCMVEIKKDVTLRVAFIMGLRDNETDVELEVGELISFDDTAQTQLLNITQ